MRTKSPQRIGQPPKICNSRSPKRSRHSRPQTSPKEGQRLVQIPCTVGRRGRGHAQSGKTPGASSTHTNRTWVEQIQWVVSHSLILPSVDINLFLQNYTHHLVSHNIKNSTEDSSESARMLLLCREQRSAFGTHC